jgi:uncharacterized protein (DUF1697 family)
MRLAVLLRAVNVGGTGKLPMAELRRVLAEAGYAEPKTLLASGNAVIAAKAEAGLEARLEKLIADQLGVATLVMVRSHRELAAVVGENPFGELAETAPSRLMVVFLRGAPSAQGVAAAAAKITGSEEVRIGPACIYVAYPDGMGTSKFTGAVIEKALGLKGTARNFNTVRKLVELTEQPSS